MNCENYEKKYKEALERAKKQREDYQKELDKTDKNTQLAGLLRAGISAIELAFPELKESEDEKIRKALVWHLKADVDFVSNGVTKAECLAYLEKQKDINCLACDEHLKGYLAGRKVTEEKQKEQKPAEEDGPFNEDEFLENELSAFLQNYDKEYDDDAAVSDVARHFYEIGKKQKEQKPVEWSEDDEKMLQSIIKDFRAGKVSTIGQEQWLKFLRPQTKEELAKMLQDEYNKGKETGEREGYTKGYDKGYKDANESSSYHFPIMPTTPSGWGCDGTHCTNPQMDCINCPRKTTGGSFSTSSASGTSAATLHGNTSVTDGKEHNSSFTD